MQMQYATMFAIPPAPGYYQPAPHHHQHHHYSPRHYHDDRASFSGHTSASHTSTAHARPPVRRSRTLGSPEVDPAGAWAHVAKTCAWVLEQQFAEMAAANDETVRWVHAQQARDALREQAALRVVASGRRGWAAAEEALHPHPPHPPHPPHSPHPPQSPQEQSQSARRRRRWESDVERMFEDEMARLEEYRRQGERQRAVLEQRRREAAEEQAWWEHREARRSRRREAEREAQEEYEARWAELLSTSEGSLGFCDVPWPTFAQPRSLEELTPAKVAKFVLSPSHPGEAHRDKIRNALRRWHPDRFGRVLARAADDERETIEEGMGIVARCLNNLLEKGSQ